MGMNILIGTSRVLFLVAFNVKLELEILYELLNDL